MINEDYLQMKKIQNKDNSFPVINLGLLGKALISGELKRVELVITDEMKKL